MIDANAIREMNDPKAFAMLLTPAPGSPCGSRVPYHAIKETRTSDGQVIRQETWYQRGRIRTDITMPSNPNAPPSRMLVFQAEKQAWLLFPELKMRIKQALDMSSLEQMVLKMKDAPYPFQPGPTIHGLATLQMTTEDGTSIVVSKDHGIPLQLTSKDMTEETLLVEPGKVDDRIFEVPLDYTQSDLMTMIQPALSVKMDADNKPTAESIDAIYASYQATHKDAAANRKTTNRAGAKTFNAKDLLLNKSINERSIKI